LGEFIKDRYDVVHALGGAHGLGKGLSALSSGGMGFVVNRCLLLWLGAGLVRVTHQTTSAAFKITLRAWVNNTPKISEISEPDKSPISTSPSRWMMR